MKNHKDDYLVLIIDDDEDGAALIEKTLASVGYRTAWAHDGECGKKLIAELFPHIVLLDVEMPNTNGFQTLEWIRNHPVFSDLVVIMLTALNKRDSVMQCLKLGANDYLVKPASIVSIQEKIDAHRRRNQASVVPTLSFLYSTLEELAFKTTYTVPVQAKALSNDGIVVQSRLKFLGKTHSLIRSKEIFLSDQRVVSCKTIDSSSTLKQRETYLTALNFQSGSIGEVALRYAERLEKVNSDDLTRGF